MNFQLSLSQKSLIERARAFALAEIAPYAAQWDAQEHIPPLFPFAVRSANKGLLLP